MPLKLSLTANKNKRKKMNIKNSTVKTITPSLLFISLFSVSEAADKNDEVEFDRSLLILNENNEVSIRRFEKGATVLPGIYSADVYVNDRLTGNQSVEVRENGSGRPVPCLSPLQIRRLGLDAGQLSVSSRDKMNDDKSCIDITEGMKDVSLDLDVGAQRLNITVPQSVAVDPARGTVDPALWDEGIPAAILGYNINGYQSHSRNETTNSVFGDIRGGINLGQWYFRHNGTFSGQDGSSTQYETLNTYVQRDITPWKSTLLLGEVNTRGQLFDTVPLKGALLQTDERMLPASLRGYAPEVYGSARTNARVTVRQNGRVIYEKTVTPGAFVINDLYPTGYGGNLDVLIQEADGSTQTYTVPYASVTQLLRPGQQRFEVAAGELNDKSLGDKPNFIQFSYQRGLNNIITGYTGSQLAEGYISGLIGSAVSTPVGALAVDITHSQTKLEGNEKNLSGQSYKLSYSKFLTDTNTNFSLAFYRFSTDGYLSFTDGARMRDLTRRGEATDNLWRQKSRATLTASQGLAPGFGSFYVSGFTQNYWNSDKTDLQYQVGYNNVYKNLSYNISAGRVRNSNGDMDTNFNLSISVPLGSISTSHTPTFNASLSRTGSSTGQQAGLSGTAGEDDQFSYGVSAAHYSGGAGSSASLNGQYRTAMTNLTGSYSQGKNYHSAGAGVSGTVVGYKGGLVFSPYTGDNFAIIEAEGAEGAQAGSYRGTRIDRWGRALVPYLNPYEMNSLSIDPKDTKNEVELQTTTQSVAPRSGAVSLLSFKTKTGTSFITKAVTPDGKALPFGAEVYDDNNNNVGSVGQMGLIYALVQDKKGNLHVRTEEQGNDCTVNYDVNEHRSPQSVVCR
ncbi:fimbria/pilus outer membrane usher protein [Enterobacter cloacae]|nr:fimbrial biogenesis outer membrane usher protein [Enterobacter cloacae]